MQTHRRITLLGLSSLAREHNQAGLVSLQSFHVDQLALLAQVSPPVIYNHTDTSSLLPPDPSLLELGERESTALTDLAVVADGLCAHGRTKKGEWADTEGGCLGFACCASAELASWLVKPGAHAALPILSEMVAVKDCRTT
jgi:hypothetical protein